MPRPYWDDQFRETESERVARWRKIKQARIDAGLCAICAKAECGCTQQSKGLSKAGGE